MGLKVKVHIDNVQIKRIIEKKQKLIKDNITTVVRNQAVPHLITLIMKGYDGLSDRANQLPEDPTNPANWRAEFLTKLQEDLEQNLIITNRGLIVRIGDKEFLGYGDGKDSDNQSPLVWLVYYIEGLVGDWGFITPDLYEKFRGDNSFDSTWGRFGQGFMISREEYEAEGWGAVVSFEQIKHPFSGFSPIDIFTEALREFKIRPFLDKAIKASAEGRKI